MNFEDDEAEDASTIADEDDKNSTLDKPFAVNMPAAPRRQRSRVLEVWNRNVGATVVFSYSPGAASACA